MKITDEQIKSLLGTIAEGKDEGSCDSCVFQLAEFAESQLTGQEVPDALRAIEEHLKECSECSEELRFIKRALEGEFEES